MHPIVMSKRVLLSSLCIVSAWARNPTVDNMSAEQHHFDTGTMSPLRNPTVDDTSAQQHHFDTGTMSPLRGWYVSGGLSHTVQLATLQQDTALGYAKVCAALCTEDEPCLAWYFGPQQTADAVTQYDVPC